MHRSCHEQLLFQYVLVETSEGKNEIPFGMMNRGGTLMEFYEQLTLFQTAYDFMKNNQYNLIHIQENQKEIWLEKTEQKKTNIIRIQQGGFDWKNHLKRDVAQVFQITKSMKKMLAGKEVIIHNIYISRHEPIDDWEQLKRPLQLEEKKHPIKMHVYYITNESKNNELNRLQDMLALSSFSENDVTTDDEANKVLIMYQQSFNRLIQSAKNKKNVFSYGKPFFTYILIGINLLLFLMLEISGGSTDISTLLKYGANHNLSIVMDNEWWRIIASMFLHIGWAHIAMNMIAIYFLGSIVERIYGSIRFLIIYFLAGIGGGLASFLFPENISAGASGAIFGLFGALLFFGVIYKKIFFQTMGKGVLLIIGINIIFGFGAPNIDMAGHIGGIITGFIASVMVYLPNKKHIYWQLGAVMVYLLLVIGLTFSGVQQTKNTGGYYLSQIDELLASEDYQTVVKLATTALENTRDAEKELRFQRSYANIHIDHLEKARDDLLAITALDPSFAKAYHNLASIYFNEGALDKAEEAIQKAVDLDNSASNQQLYDLIFGNKPTKK